MTTSFSFRELFVEKISPSSFNCNNFTAIEKFKQKYASPVDIPLSDKKNHSVWVQKFSIPIDAGRIDFESWKRGCSSCRRYCSSPQSFEIIPSWYQSNWNVGSISWRRWWIKLCLQERKEFDLKVWLGNLSVLEVPGCYYRWIMKSARPDDVSSAPSWMGPRYLGQCL